MSEKPASLRELLALFAARLVLAVSAWLPLHWARSIGRLVGRLMYRLDGKARRVAERNIHIAYPSLSESGRADLARNTLMETGMLALEMGHVWRKPWPETEKLILDVEGGDLLKDATDKGRGVIVLAPHLGNWEIVGLHLANFGNTVALYKPPRFASLGALVRQARQRSGSELVPTTPRGIAAIVRSVRNGGISGILPDQVPDDLRAGINVPFMGHQAFTATLSCNLLQRSGAVAIMGAAFRVPGGFKVSYRTVDEDLYSETPEIALTALNREVARMIDGWDAQYQWQYKRYRACPPGPTDPYIDLMAPRD